MKNKKTTFPPALWLHPSRGVEIKPGTWTRVFVPGEGKCNSGHFHLWTEAHRFFIFKGPGWRLKALTMMQTNIQLPAKSEACGRCWCMRLQSLWRCVGAVFAVYRSLSLRTSFSGRVLCSLEILTVRQSQTRCSLSTSPYVRRLRQLYWFKQRSRIYQR